MSEIMPIERVENKIYLIRKQKVMLDSDLAELYGVSTKRLNEQMRRNKERFPGDFMFKLTDKEDKNLMSQNATSSWRNKLGLRSQNATSKKGGRRYLPYVFTEQGVAMLSSVLKSKKAIQVNIAIMRAFVKLNRVLTSHIEISKKLKELDERLAKTQEEVREVFAAIRKLTAIEDKPKRQIGFLRG